MLKKLLCLSLVFLLCVTFWGCGGDAESADGKMTTKKLTLDEVNTIADYADFRLFKVSTAKEVRASIGGSIYYENDNDGETFVDIILDWTNLSGTETECDEIVVASATGTNGKKYTKCLYAVETGNATSLSQYEEIAPLTTVRLHCALYIPESETDLMLQLKIKGKLYTFPYTLGEVAVNTLQLQPGDVIEEADFAKINFLGTEYTDDVLPSDTSGFYTHYSVDNPSNTYMVVKLELTNLLAGSRDLDEFLGIKILYNGKYAYKGFMVMEDSDGTGFDVYGQVDPLETRYFYYLIEVPKSVMEYDFTLTFFFAGKEYTFAGN